MDYFIYRFRVLDSIQACTYSPPSILKIPQELNSRGNALLCIFAPCSSSKDCLLLKCTLVCTNLAWLLQEFFRGLRELGCGYDHVTKLDLLVPFLNIQKSMQHLSEGRRYLFLCLASSVKILPFLPSFLFCTLCGTTSLPLFSSF